MGRRFPSTNDGHYNYSIESAHPLLSLSFFIVGMAIIITISTTLCGYGTDQELESKSSPKSKELETDDQVSESEQTDDGSQREYSSDYEEGIDRGLPLPPSKQLRGTHSCNNFSKITSVSRRNLSKAMSVNLKRSVLEAKTQYRMEKKERKKLKNEDSVWMKTIILGEKCKVPGDDENYKEIEDEIDEVLVDGKGRKVRAYHPRTMSSYGLSTTTTILSQSIDDGNDDPHHPHPHDHVLVSSNSKKEEQI